MELGSVEIEDAGGSRWKRLVVLWYHWLDGSVTYALNGGTSKANAVFTGYASDKTIYFKTQLKIKDVPQEMSDAIYVKIS